MIRRGLVTDRAAAVSLITTNRILVGGAVAANPARLTAASEALVVTPTRARFVSRAGEKLEAAIERFSIQVSGRRAMDVGSSTGGFTDCLLQRGAESVMAVDVGTNQLHERLRNDPRVEVREQTNVRHLTVEDVAPSPDLVVTDVSFMSLASLVPHLVDLGDPGADFVVLVKPQFEATRAEADRERGVITDPDIWARVLSEVLGAFVAAGATIMGVMASPVRGTHGNVEFCLHAVGPAHGGSPTVSIAEQVAMAVDVEGARQ